RCASVVQSGFGGATTACECVAPCAKDTDCGMGQVCVCAGVVKADVSFSYCATATCTTGEDCPSGECAITAWANGCYTDVELACRTPNDACRTDADCSSMPGTTCVIPGPGQPFTCLGTGCAIGRPLIVEGAPRTAEPTARG